MSDSSEQDRSELPTSYKLKRAREKGTVARGMDLGIMVGLAAFLGCAWIWGDEWIGEVTARIRQAMVTGPQLADSRQLLLDLVAFLGAAALRPLCMLLAAVFFSVLVFELMQTGIVFATSALKIDFNRLNPATGLKRIFSVRMLIETAKSVGKLAVYGGLTVWVILSLSKNAYGAIQDASGLSHALLDVTIRLTAMLLGAALVFMAFDQFVSRRDFLKKMRMSRRELRRESRDRDGDPRLKQRRRQMHGEFSKLSQSLKNIRGADVLITNPTHYAVALKYDSNRMTAPKVVATGSNRIALRLKRLAFLYGVVVVENPPLARALARLPLNSETPEVLFRPIADIYLRLRSQKTSDRGGTRSAA